jgi:hypothetical protein
MNKTASSFFIGDTPKGASVAALPDRAGGARAFASILNHVALTNESLEQATARLIRLAELAYNTRRFDDLKPIADALLSIPFAAAQKAGKYYQAVLVMRAGQLNAAASMLAPISAPRALLTLGAIHRAKGDSQEAARYNVEAMHAGMGRDLFTFACASAQLATIRAIEGDHAGSLYAFESLAPIMRAIAKAHPHVIASWHNSRAIELAELGRITEAQQAVSVALASSIAHAYPEFQETAAELRQVQPERIAVVVTPQEETATPEAAPVIITTHSEPPRRHRFTYSIHAHTLLNPRASPRAPPSLFRLLRL